MRTVEELRAELRLARERFSVREIGRATGVGRSTLNLLLGDGLVPRPTTATIRKLSAWLDAAGATGAEDVGEERAVSVAAPVAAADGLATGAAATHAQPAGYWQGVAEATVRMLAVAGDELQSLIDSGVFERLATRAGAEGPPHAPGDDAPGPPSARKHGAG